MEQSQADHCADPLALFLRVLIAPRPLVLYPRYSSCFCFTKHISAPSTEKSHCVSLSPPSSTFLSSTLIWKKPPGKALGLFSQDSFHVFPFSLLFHSWAVCCSESEHALLYLYFLDLWH